MGNILFGIRLVKNIEITITYVNVNATNLDTSATSLLKLAIFDSKLTNVSEILTLSSKFLLRLICISYCSCFISFKRIIKMHQHELGDVDVGH